MSENPSVDALWAVLKAYAAFEQFDKTMADLVDPHPTIKSIDAKVRMEIAKALEEVATVVSDLVESFEWSAQSAARGEP